MRKEDCYFVGKITRRHGYSGNVILKLDTDQPEYYNKLESIFIEINGLLVPFFIEKSQWNKMGTLILTFKNTQEALIDQILGKDTYLPLSSLPPLSGNQFYYHEVIGFSIIDTQGKNYGQIASINDMAAQPYFVLNLHQNEVIIPIIKDWIVKVNRENQQIQMQLPDGLLNIFLQDSKPTT